MCNNGINSGERNFAAGPAGCLPAEDYLWQICRLRYNVLSGKVEYRKVDEPEEAFRPFTDKMLKSIILQSHRDGYVGKEDISSDLKLLVESDDIPQYDPALDWLKGLKWDGKERVVDFLKRIPGITADEIYFLSIWMRSVVAQILGVSKEHGNECVPTLIGEQGVGKSTFFLRILPEHLRNYYIDNLRLSNNFDKDMALTNNLIVNLDEFDMYTPAQQTHIKQLLSRVSVNNRTIYGRTQEVRSRRASCTATTNNPRPLNDPTGSRRYICIRIPKGMLIDNETPIDYDQLYAQLMHEVLEEKQRYWFTNEEVLRLQRHNAQFQNVKTLEQMLQSCIRPVNEDESDSNLTTDDIINKVEQIYPNTPTSSLTRARVGRAMNALGYVAHRTKHGVQYPAAFKDVA